MGFPVQRMRRLRKNEAIRTLVRENSVSVSNLICPFFVVDGQNTREEIRTMPGNYRMSIDVLLKEIEDIRTLGINAVLLFGIPVKKDLMGTDAYSSDGIVQRAVAKIKDRYPDLIVITDVCLCEYTEHGHCGVMQKGYLLNDESLELIAKVALSHAQAGSDMVAPAAMLDGQIRAIRTILDNNNFHETAIMAYSAKYASKLYDLFFRDGTGGVLAYGDKRTHQMDCSNSDEAMREIALDIEEGADIIMVKPSLFYLDIVYRAKTEFKMPLAVYNVSGEFAMVNALYPHNNVDKDELCREIMTSFRRAGADMIITYHAREFAKLLQ
ncbi:MAG: porphobilinogen synthase [Fibrobacter sp.]|nr:porphobilinogen synthase [Fibrobacter sp.]